MISQWKFLETGTLDGQANMDCDLLLAESLLRGITGPTLRIYQWNPWCVSLGCNQPKDDINWRECLTKGIGVVRRPTGGRAILHAEELTYSIVMPIDQTSVGESYNRISKALLRGLRFFGVNASFEKGVTNFAQAYKDESAMSCFGTSAQFEIQVDGRKLVGSAQRRLRLRDRTVLLQHGSILCGNAHKRLIEFLQPKSNPETIRKIQDSLERKTTNLRDIIGGPIDMKSLGDSIRRGFELEWGIEFVPFMHKEAHAESIA